MKKKIVFKDYGEKPSGNWAATATKDGFFSRAILVKDNSFIYLEFPNVTFATNINLN